MTGQPLSWADDLAKVISGAVLTDESALAAAAFDFGRVVERCPQAVVRPSSVEDVAAVVKFAARHNLKIAPRGAGHSQSGQSLSDQIVLDMTSLNYIKSVQEESATVEAGIKWRALVEHLAPRNLMPPILTNN